MARCRAADCTREEETKWVTDAITDDGHNEQVPVCGKHLVQLANREPVRFRDDDESPRNPPVWVIRAQLPSGLERFYGTNWWGGEFTPAPGSAVRYESENAARYMGYELKERKVIVDFTVEEIQNPRRL